MTSGTTLDDYTDRYAQRVRGMTASEIRALFSVANRPEVVSLAGGSPYVASLPLDAVGAMLAELGSTHGATTLQYGIGQGDLTLRERICDVMTLSGIDVTKRRLARRRRGDGRRTAGNRPDQPRLPRPPVTSCWPRVRAMSVRSEFSRRPRLMSCTCRWTMRA